MWQNLQEISFIPAADLASDLAILKTNPTILDAFLPPALQSRTPPPTSSSNAPAGLAILDQYDAETATPPESVALSRAFVDAARNGALRLVEDGPEGTLGTLGEEIEQVRARAEQLQQSLEGL
jgi:hypothetical protein